MSDIIQLVRDNTMLSLGAVGLVLLTGKFFRVIIVAPVAFLISKTPFRKDKVLLSIAEKDLGISDEIQQLENPKEDDNAR